MSGIPKRKPGRTPELVLTVQYGTRYSQLPSRAKLRLWARAALLRQNARVTLRLIGAREARRLNREYRRRDYATNVLTFVYSKRAPLEGDIAICAPVVAREARLAGVRRAAHYAHLAVHGMLHLQGFDHARAADARRMEKLETRILAHLGYADPYGRAPKKTPPARKHGR
jgi:probable rRNA maturation factor